MGQLDAYRCAQLPIRQHGEDASIPAALRADELEPAGDEAGRHAWLAILAAVDELGRKTRRPSEGLQ